MDYYITPGNRTSEIIGMNGIGSKIVMSCKPADSRLVTVNDVCNTLFNSLCIAQLKKDVDLKLEVKQDADLPSRIGVDQFYPNPNQGIRLEYGFITISGNYGCEFSFGVDQQRVKILLDVYTPQIILRQQYPINFPPITIRTDVAPLAEDRVLERLTQEQVTNPPETYPSGPQAKAIERSRQYILELKPRSGLEKELRDVLLQHNDRPWLLENHVQRTYQKTFQSVEEIATFFNQLSPEFLWSLVSKTFIVDVELQRALEMGKYRRALEPKFVESTASLFE